VRELKESVEKLELRTQVRQQHPDPKLKPKHEPDSPKPRPSP
jgi:hypothetical protein